MRTFEWSPSLEVGEKEIDEEHRRLIVALKDVEKTLKSQI